MAVLCAVWVEVKTVTTGRSIGKQTREGRRRMGMGRLHYWVYFMCCISDPFPSTPLYCSMAWVSFARLVDFLRGCTHRKRATGATKLYSRPAVLASEGMVP